MANPWQALDHQRIDESSETRADAQVEHGPVDTAYRYLGGDPIECVNPACDQMMYYRDTVGAMMCATCKSIAHTNGKPVRIGNGGR